MRDFRFAPAECRRRGLPVLAARVAIPDGLEVETPADGPVVLIVREPGAGALALEIFAAGLIIDRDGILRDIATEHAKVEGPVRSVELVELEHGPSGARAEVHRRGDPLPYVSVYAVAASDLAMSSGALITVRSARLEWDAGAAMLDSLRLGARDLPANDAAMMPLVVKRRS